MKKERLWKIPVWRYQRFLSYIHFILQWLLIIDATSYEVDSQSTDETYTVTLQSTLCTGQTCGLQCTAVECGHLCHHMFKCTCPDYKQGHICKHTHKVHCTSCLLFVMYLLWYQNSGEHHKKPERAGEPRCNRKRCACTNAVNPPKEKQSKAGYFNIKCT